MSESFEQTKLTKRMPCNLCRTVITANGRQMDGKIRWVCSCPLCGNTRIIEEAEKKPSVTMSNENETIVLESSVGRLARKRRERK